MSRPAKSQGERTNQKLDESSFLLKNDPLPMWIYDLETLSFLEVNKAAVKQYGYSRTEFLQMRLADIQPGEDAERRKVQVRTKRQRLQYSGEWRHIKKDGTLIYVDITSRKLIYKGHKAVLIVAKDITESKRIHFALKESQAELMDVIESAMDAIIMIDEKQNIMLFNPAAEKMFQYSAAKIVGKPLKLLIPSRFRESHEKHVRDFGKSGTTRRSAANLGRLVGVRADGTEFPIEVSISTSKRSDRKFYTAIVRDISESLRAEEKLRESAAQYKLLFESAPIGIGLVDLSGKFLAFNDAILKPGGYSREDIVKIGNVNFLYAHPAQRKQVLAVFRRQGYVSGYEVQFKRKDGSVYDAQLSLSKVNINGQFCIQALVEDINNRKQAIEALRESEERFRSLFENTTIGIYRTTPDGRILMANPAVVKMLEYQSFDELAKVNLEKDRSDEEYSRKEFKKRIEQEGMIRGREASWTTKNGKRIYVRESAQAIRSKNGRVLYYEGTIEDITERKKAEEALRASQSELLALFSVIPDVVLVLDKDGCHLNIASKNPNVQYLPAEELLGKRLHDIFSRQKADRLVGYIHRALRTHQLVHFEYAVLVGNKIMWFSGITTPLTKTSVVWVARDITSQKQNEEQTQRHLVELQTLYESGLAFGRTMSVQAIGEQIIHVLKKHLDWRDATVRLHREVGNEMELIAFSSRDKSKAIIKRALAKITRVGQGMSGWAMEHNQVVCVGDLTKDARYVETFSGMKSGLYVPMMIGEIAIGVISVESEQFGVFDENDERLLTTLAAQAAAAIQNARLFQQSQRRAIESATLYDVTSELATLNDIPSLLQTIAKDIAMMLGVPGGVVYRYESRRSELEVVATTDSNMPAGIRMQLGEGMTGRIAQSREPMIIDDYKTWEGAASQYKDQPFYSVLGVPMLYGGELIGVLVAHGLHATASMKEKNRKFTERDTRLLTLFASAAAGAVYSARLLESERKRLQEARTLQKAAAALTSSLNVDKILDSLLDGLSQVIPFSTSAVFISEGKSIRLVAERGHGSKSLIGQLFPLEDSMQKYVLEIRAPLILADAQADPRFHTFDDSQVVRSWMGMPLIAHEKVIGYLTLANNQPNSYDRSYAELAMAIANQAATTIENARLFQDAVRYAQRWATLHAVSQEIARVGEDLEQVYAAIHHAVAKLLPLEVFTIALLDNQRTSIDAVYLYDRGERSPAMKIPFGKGFSSKVIASGISIKVDDDQESQVEGIPFGAPEMARSILAVPLRVSDKIIGAMSVQSYQPKIYSSEDQLLLELLATQAAIAIENTRLFEETRRSALEFKTLYEMTRDISLQQDSDSLLKMIVTRASELLQSPVCGFYLYDAERQEVENSYSTGLNLPSGNRLKLGEGAAGLVALTREPLLIEDYRTWEGRSLSYEGIPFRAVLAVPILYGGELIGVLDVNELGDSERKYTQNDASLLSLFAAHAASVMHNARLLDQLKDRLEQFSALHSIDLVIGSTTDLRVSLQIVLEAIVRLLKVNAAGILLYNPATFNLEFAGGVGFLTDVTGSVVRLGEGLAGRAALTRQMVDVPRLSTAELPLPLRQLIDREGFVSYRSIPLIAKGEVKGVLELYHKSALPSNQEWNNLLNLLAGQAAIAIDNAMLFNNLEYANTELELAYDATIEGWSQALELRDHETSGHTRRMLDTTMALARKMGISDSELPNIRRGVLLHDIGKMGVPDRILLKAGPLDEEEWKIMRQHPLNGYNLLSKITYLHSALDIPYCHHEKWDGSGYPRGLKGEQIPIAARMFSVVDVYDALCFDRPYRSAWPKERVVAYIKEQSGKYFDPHVVESFLEMVA